VGRFYPQRVRRGGELDGYWPAWLGRIKTRLIARAIDRQRRWRDEWNRLETASQGATARPNLNGAAPTTT
jgi:hypothetical protein